MEEVGGDGPDGDPVPDTPSPPRPKTPEDGGGFLVVRGEGVCVFVC